MNLSKNIITSWDLQNRTINVLKDEGITTLGDLLAISPSFLLKAPNFGQKSLDDIIYNLNQENLINNEHLIGWIKYLDLNRLNLREEQDTFYHKKYLFKDIEELEISSGSLNDLKKEKIINIADLFKKSKINTNGRLYNYNLRKETLEEIEELIHRNFQSIIIKKIAEEDSSIVKKISEKDNNNFNINMLEEWPLSARTSNALATEGITYVGELVGCSEKDLWSIKNFGKKSIDELEVFLKQLNFTFNMFVGEWDPPSKNLEKSENNKNYFILSKSLFNNPEEVKKKTFEEKTLISLEMLNSEVEQLIIESINEMINSLNEKYQDIFKSRFAYETKYRTLEECGKYYSITRERVRQLEKNLIKHIPKLGKIHKLSLVKFLLKNEDASFHKIFPNLDKKFIDTTHRSGKFSNTTGDSLIYFLEIFCEVEPGFFKPPEVMLLNFDKEKIKSIFTESYFPIFKEFFIEELKKNYGYNDSVAQSAFDYMEKSDIIINKNNKIFPKNISKNLEVANILQGFPEGLDWKRISRIGNKSPTKNTWDLGRNIADSSMSMEHNPYIYLSDRGRHKSIKYLKHLDKKDDITQHLINEMKIMGKSKTLLEPIYKKLDEQKKFFGLNFFEVRAIIKLFGEEKGLFHNGASGRNAISLSKNFSNTNIKNEIFDIVNNHKEEIALNEIEKIFYKDLTSSNKALISTRLNSLVDEGKIFKINPGVFLNYEDGMNMSNTQEIEIKIKEIIRNYEFLTPDFLREFLNKLFGYNLSTLYYKTLIKTLAKKNSWFSGLNYLSDKSEKKTSLENFIKKKFDVSKDTDENFLNISKIVGISKKSFDTIIYNSNLKFDTSWMDD